MSTTISCRVDEESARRLDELAKTTDRTKAWHVEQALKNYFELLDWQIRHIKKAMKEVEEGKVIPHEEVFAKLRQRIAKDRKKRA